MDQSSEPRPNPQSADDLEFIRVQYTQAVESYRAQFTLLVQIATVLTVANATVVGYALSTQIAGILFIGFFFPLIILYVTYFVLRMTLPILYTAVYLEQGYLGIERDWLVSTFLSTTISHEFVSELRSISSLQDLQEKYHRINKMPLPLPGRGPSILRVGLVLLALSQAIAPLILCSVFGWRLF